MKPDTERDYRERILAVLIHIQTHLDEELSIEALARIACFSPFHFHRVFRAMVGEPLGEHIRRLRLECAAHWLRYGRKSVTRIAFDSGFEAHEAFTRAFLRAFGTSPSAYRARHRPAQRAPSHVHWERPRRFEPVKGDDSVEVRIEKVVPMRVAFMRHVRPYQQVGKVWEKLMAWAAPQGLLGPRTKCIGVPHDDPDVTESAKIRYDACVTVDAQFRPAGEIGVEDVSGGEYAVKTHRGPYERLGETYRRLYGDWLPASGREPRDVPPFEVFRNSPYDTASEALLTDIYLPLETR